jgi:hypothetical protein
MDAFLSRLSEQRGRPITLLPMAGQPGAPYGLLATTAGTDYIFFAANTSLLHQQHIVLHEVAHLVCGHDRTAGADAAAPLPQFAGLLDGLSPELVRRVLGRQAYTEPQEQEAELLASLLLCRAGRPVGPESLDDLQRHPGLGILLALGPRVEEPHGG